MRRLSDTIVRLKQMARTMPQAATVSTRLRRFSGFGPNPGELLAWIYVPENAGEQSPLVVVLHGCTQNAAGYDESSGWSRLADQHGFIVLYPEQSRSNNPNLCFNWFSSEDAARGKGEAQSISEMVVAVQTQYRTDKDRVFVTGLSAGGAMAAAMLATYPEIFAGGAVIAGLPYGVAQSIPEAFDRMRGHGGPRQAELSDLVRRASNHGGNWPILSIWHGSGDQTVAQSNAIGLIEQWREIHGASKTPSKTEMVRGYPRRVWHDAQGREVIEEYSITGLAHGTPLDTRSSQNHEKAAPFMLEAGISSTQLISRFWGLGDDVAQTDLQAASPLPLRAIEQPHEVAPEAARYGQPFIERTIHDALRSAGLMR